MRRDMSRRQIVRIDGEAYVVLSQTKKRLMLERLTGDFSDFRKVLGITQQEMAQQLGVSQGTLSKMESGELQLNQAAKRLVAEVGRLSIGKAIEEEPWSGVIA